MNVTTNTCSHPGQRSTAVVVVLACVLVVLLSTGCGGSKQDADVAAIENTAAQSDVLTAAVALDKAAINGGDIRGDTLTLAHSIRAARDQGVSDQWLSKEIDDAESTVIDLCDDCYSILEDAR